MNSKLTLVLLSLSITFYCCKSYTPDQLPEKQLVFGNGGGFAGIETAYTLLENGQLFKHNSHDSIPKELTKLGRKTAQQFFTALNDMAFDTISLNDPGNIYQFIQLQEEGKTHKVTWNAANEAADSTQLQIGTVYKDLVKLIPTTVKPTN